MFRSIARSLMRFVAACVLLVLILCAGEVWLRSQRVRTALSEQPPSTVQLTRPNTTTYLEVIPLIEQTVGDPSANQFTIRTNEYGLRGESVTVPKPEGVYRILCLGADDVFGSTIREEETVAGQLQTMFQQAGLNHVEVLNGGCPGSGPLTNYLRLRQSLMILKPDLVIYTLSPSDLPKDSDLTGGLTLCENGHPAFARHPTCSADQENLLATLTEEFVIASWLSENSAAITGFDAPAKSSTRPVVPKDLELGISAFLEMQDLLAAFDCKLLVSILPKNSAEPATGEKVPEPARELTARLQQAITDLQLEHNLFVDAQSGATNDAISLSDPSLSDPSLSDPSLSDPSLSDPSKDEPSKDEPTSAEQMAVYTHRLGTFLATHFSDALRNPTPRNTTPPARFPTELTDPGFSPLIR
ncbi:hypothetical protein KOR42_34980 [Thalassoglobus neptunius]|uniref:SGNH hydrolase-type esterase domain-containing protein n=1 Tax=Thalassoglobus neptunius TaxID=1938619 RepID=A0A5C5WLR4_9PLAN|nr:hypothetical protein [Thalassoglobus neptunius]TWT51610.1 hypothetical protein KOR42_34980 [Thalassoglobus neptunius]